MKSIVMSVFEKVIYLIENCIRVIIALAFFNPCVHFECDQCLSTF